MTQIQPNLLELAKQGNAKAIATLMNRQLQPKGITAKAALKDGCLQIMLESAQVPNQQALVAFIRKGITSLEVAFIEKVKVYGHQIGEDFPAWSQEFKLGTQTQATSLPNSSPPSTPLQNAKELTSSLKSTTRSTAELIGGIPKPINGESQATKINSILPSLNRSLDTLDIFLLALVGFLGFIFLSTDISVGLSTLVFNGLFALIPAQIAKNKGRKFIRWYCYGFLQLFIALIVILLLNKTQGLAPNKESEAQASSNVQTFKLEEEQKAYLLLLDPVHSPIKNLQTNLAQTTLEEFRKVQARVNVGVSHNDLPAVLTPAKFAVQNFERSKDYNVSTHLNYLIGEIMFFYELSQQVLKSKVLTISQPFAYPSFGGIGIPTNSALGESIKQKFPELIEKYVGFGSSCYEFDITIKTIWLKASELSDKLQEILELALH